MNFSYLTPALLSTNIGKAVPFARPLKPHIACPTTFGTASECTGIAILNFLEIKTTGIPNGLKGVGDTGEDSEDLAEGAIPQRRLIDNAPLPNSRERLKELFKKAPANG